MKQKITNVSIALFEDKGFSQTSIQDIVDELDVTKGTFYYYFSSKEQLLMDIHLDYITNLLERQRQIIKKDISSKEKLSAIVEVLIFDIVDKGASGRVFFREFRHLLENNIDIIKEKRNQFRLNIESVISEGVANNEFRTDLDIRMVTLGILGLTNYSYNWFKPSGATKPAELVEIYLEMMFNGISK